MQDSAEIWDLAETPLSTPPLPHDHSHGLARFSASAPLG